MARPRPKAAAQPRTASKKAPRASAEVVSEEAGLGLPEGVIIVTTLVLLAAFIFIDKARGSYGEGMFFKNSAATSSAN